jgi:hypothetical protein
MNVRAGAGAAGYALNRSGISSLAPDELDERLLN